MKYVLHVVRIAVAVCATILAIPNSPTEAAAAKFKIVYSFCSQADCTDGANPVGTLAQDMSGNLYGIAPNGGAYGKGVVYELKQNRKGQFKYHVLYSFCPSGGICSDGNAPIASLAIDNSGNLYGITAAGGGGTSSGTVFELLRGVGGAAWTLHTLKTFCSEEGCIDGEEPTGGLAYAGAITGQPYDGTSPLYGSAMYGGNGNGVAFSLQPGSNGWAYQVIHEFCSDDCGDGENPDGAIVEDTSGNLYGTTVNGGTNDQGNIYELIASNGTWNLVSLHGFCDLENCLDGMWPTGGVSMDNAGDFLGTTAFGGCDTGCEGEGIAYMLVPDGEQSEFTILHHFCLKNNCPDGNAPEAAPFPGQGNESFGTAPKGGGSLYVYGGAGVVYELMGAQETILHKFCRRPGCRDGEEPEGGVTVAQSGILFGTTAYGGPGGGGVIYELDVQ